MKIILSIVCLLIAGCSQDQVKIESIKKTKPSKEKKEISIKKEEPINQNIVKPVKKINHEKVNQLKEELKEAEDKLKATVKEQSHFPKEGNRYKNLEESKKGFVMEIAKLKKEIWKETN